MSIIRPRHHKWLTKSYNSLTEVKIRFFQIKNIIYTFRNGFIRHQVKCTEYVNKFLFSDTEMINFLSELYDHHAFYIRRGSVSTDLHG